MGNRKPNKLADGVDSVLSAFGRLFTGRPITSAIRNVRHTRQRIKRGWDDSATWSLDIHLAKTLGAQLKHLADTSHGYPGGSQYATFEDWQAVLNLHGDALTTYAEKMFDYNVNDTDREQIVNDAQAALRWVADNLVSLWD